MARPAACMAAFFALFGAHVASGLRGPAPTHPPPEGMDHPDIVVGGIGDAGNTAVIRGLEDIGLHFCRWHDQFDEPHYAHWKREEFIQDFLMNGNYTMTREAYMQTPKLWKQAVDHHKNVAQQEAWCVLKEKDLHVPPRYKKRIRRDKPWGYMEPHFSWLMPVMDEAFSNQTKYLLVARDPRDICNSTQATDQFWLYGMALNITDCYVWWATYWDQVFTQYADSDRVKIVRIEDLAMPKPKLDQASLATVHCIARHAGLDKSNATGTSLTHSDPKPDPNILSLLRREEPTANRTEVWQQLKRFQNGMKSNMRENLHLKVKYRDALVTSTSTRPQIHSTMQKLGYHPLQYTLLNPGHPLVC